MNCLQNRAEAKGDIRRSSIDHTRSTLFIKMASVVSVSTMIMVAGTATSFAQAKIECEVKVQASSGLLDTSDLQSCSSGTGVTRALRSFFGIPQPDPPSPPSTPGGSASTTPTPGSHVAVSGTVAIDGTVSLPNGATVNVGQQVSVGDTVRSSVSPSPHHAGGIGAGGGVAGAGSVGNGSGQGSGSGSGNSFVESALSNGAASSAASGLGGGIGLGGGVGLSGSHD